MNSLHTGQIRDQICVFALSLVLILCGAYLVCDAGLALLRAHTSRNWPTTPARIEGERHCCLESQKTAIWYTYYVDGALYSGSTTALPDLSTDQVEQAIKLHKSVRVHYDPQRPEISALDPEFMRAAAIWLLGGLLYFWLGVASAWNHLARTRILPQPQLRHAA